MTVGPLRLAAVLLPAALLLHEGAYALSGGGDRGSHSYLEIALPLLAALAASLAAASLLLPLCGADGRPWRGRGPLGLAIALVAVFVVQELTEAVLAGGGSAAALASLASAWLLAPLALLLGALSSALLEWLERTGEALLAVARTPRTAAARAQLPRLRPDAPGFAPAISPLAFGLARRPPPAGSAAA